MTDEPRWVIHLPTTLTSLDAAVKLARGLRVCLAHLPVLDFGELTLAEEDKQFLRPVPAQIRNRRILLARRTLRRHWQRTNSCPVCGSRPQPLAQARRYLRQHDPNGGPLSGPAPTDEPADPDGNRRTVPRQKRKNEPRYAHPEDRHAREIIERARESWPNPDDDDQEE